MDSRKVLFTCWGSVRCGCGVAHKTEEAAEKCIAADQRGCESQGGYSDRRVREIDEAGQATKYSVTRGPGR